MAGAAAVRRACGEPPPRSDNGVAGRPIHGQPQAAAADDRAHLDEVEDAISHGNVIKFAFWGLEQDASFYEGSSPANQMIADLGREIGLTQEQLAQLGGHRAAIRQDRETLQRCLAALREAREQVHQHISHSASVMEQFRRILNPVQVARFFVWVEKHQDDVRDLSCLFDPATATTSDTAAVTQSMPHADRRDARLCSGDHAAGRSGDHAAGRSGDHATGRSDAAGCGDAHATGCGGAHATERCRPAGDQAASASGAGRIVRHMP